MTDIHTAFVTGGTGLLGNNLVRVLRAQGITVRALVRSLDKAKQQFGDQSGIEFVVGDMMKVSDFAPALKGCDVVFHTAAFFRDSYKGGRHVQALRQTNVDGTAQLLAAAWDAGVRTFIHTSSIAVLDGKGGAHTRESDERHPDRADDYYLSKIQSEGVVREFAKRHPDFRVCHVLPGWMWGPGDLGPTASGQLAADVLASTTIPPIRMRSRRVTRPARSSWPASCPAWCLGVFQSLMRAMWHWLTSRLPAKGVQASATWPRAAT